MKRAIICFIIAIILCSFTSQLLALPEGAVARLGKGRINAFTFSPDGKMLAVASSIGVYLHDAFSLAEIHFLETNTNVTSIVFSPDGSLLATTDYDAIRLKLWDMRSRTLVATLEGHSDTVESVAFSPDGLLLASGSYDKTVKLWDMRSRTLVATLRHSDSVESVAFSPDGSLLASGSSDNTIKLWDVKSGTDIATLKGHTNGVYSVAFSPDGALLASGSNDCTIILWDMKPYIKESEIYPYDVNSDGIVNILDLVIVSKYLGKPASDNAKADVNKDGTIDMLDLNIVKDHFGEIHK